MSQVPMPEQSAGGDLCPPTIGKKSMSLKRKAAVFRVVHDLVDAPPVFPHPAIRGLDVPCKARRIH